MTPEQRIAVVANAGTDLVAGFQTYVDAVTGPAWIGANQLPQAAAQPWNPSPGYVAPPARASVSGSSQYELIVPFEALADFNIVVLSADPWTASVSAGGISGEWLAEPGASWLSSGTLVIPLDPTQCNAPYWHVEIAALATVTLGASPIAVAMRATSPAPSRYAYTLGGTSNAAPSGTISTREVFIFDASALDVEIAFEFFALTDPALTCDSITGEVRIIPYELQSGQSV